MAGRTKIVSVLLLLIAVAAVILFIQTAQQETKQSPSLESEGSLSIETPRDIPSASHSVETEMPTAAMEPEILLVPGSPLDAMLEQMQLGAIAFNAPEELNIDDSAAVELLLSLQQSVDELKQKITEEGARLGAEVRISDRMEAKLTGKKFDITAITQEIQAISRIEQTRWKWEVTPKEGGTHNLHLVLTARFDIDGHNTPRTIETFSAPITVRVTGVQRVEAFVKEHWKWLWTAVFVPVFGYFWNRNRKNKKKVEEGEQKVNN